MLVSYDNDGADAGDDGLGLSLACLSLSPTHRIEMRLRSALAECAANSMDEGRAAALLESILTCQRELREWASNDRRKRIDDCIPFMTAAAAALRDALHRRLHPRCKVAGALDCVEHRAAIARLIASLAPTGFDGDAACADGIMTQFDAQLGAPDALWARADAATLAPKMIAWLEAPQAWAQPVGDATEARRIRNLVADGDQVVHELWRQLHNYRHPACAGGESCAHKDPQCFVFSSPQTPALFPQTPATSPQTPRPAPFGASEALAPWPRGSHVDGAFGQLNLLG
ncbi:hypothetical protein M885DRAFT_522369 [Pelagophyceae sp. CCMP2097]|nr:hypothetical protein M885DRAFT_522369 [Pelagophyceae sp. CCMP2097]